MTLLWTETCRTLSSPNLGLLYIRDRPLAEHGADLAMRFFNCYKSKEVDRVIGDRRSRNYVEGRLTLASPGLPAAQCLLDLEIDIGTQRFSLCCTDRKDFYHQFQVSAERAATHACFKLATFEKIKDALAFKLNGPRGISNEESMTEHCSPTRTVGSIELRISHKNSRFASTAPCA